MTEIFHIKIKEAHEKRWYFVSRDGMTGLRVHAIEFGGKEHAIEKAKEIKPVDGMTLNIKVVTLEGKTVWTNA